jgi:hypothetical protein
MNQSPGILCYFNRKNKKESKNETFTCIWFCCIVGDSLDL